MSTLASILLALGPQASEADALAVAEFLDANPGVRLEDVISDGNGRPPVDALRVSTTIGLLEAFHGMDDDQQAELLEAARRIQSGSLTPIPD